MSSVKPRSVDSAPRGEMPKHIAIQPGRLYPQPGYTLKIDKEGKWTATQIFLCHRSSAVALMPRPGSGHPEVPFISLSQVTATFDEGDLTEIVCEYAGAEEKDKETEKANATYTMGLSLSEEPLLSHLRYKDLPQPPAMPAYIVIHSPHAPEGRRFRAIPVPDASGARVPVIEAEQPPDQTAMQAAWDEFDFPPPPPPSPPEILRKAEREGIALPFGDGTVRLACGERDRALFASALVLYQTHEDLLPDDEAKAAFRQSTVVFADAAGTAHTVTVTQARQLLVAYGAAYQALWAASAQHPLPPHP